MVVGPRRRPKAAGGHTTAAEEPLMTEQLTMARVDALEDAIQTVMHDLRIPKDLRTALAVYQRTFRLPDVVQPNNPPRSTNEDRDVLNCMSPAIEEGLQVVMRHNDESFDWSVEINGQLHEHVTSEVMEALIECAVIVAQASLTRAFVHRSQ